MQTRVMEQPCRFPRPVNRFPRSPILDKEEFVNVIQEIQPLLLKAAHHISRPYYIEPEDLVQEALIKIFRTRSKYKSDKKASLKTWIMNVAMRQFYNVAITEYRKKRVPQNIHISKAFVEINDMEELSNFKHSNEYAPYSCKTEYDLRYKEIIKRTEIKLTPFAKEVFYTMLEPPDKLIKIIKRNQEKKIENKILGKSTKIPFQFIITTEQLAEHFEVPKHKITKAKNYINNAMRLAFDE